MITLSCPAPHWTKGHISQCVQDNYVAFLVPVMAVTTSVLLLLSRIAWRTSIGVPQGYSFQRVAEDDNDDAFLETEHAQEGPSGSFVREHELRIALLEPLALLADLGICAFYLGVQNAASPRLPVVIAQIFETCYLFGFAVFRLTRSRGSPNLCKEAWNHSVFLYIALWLSSTFDIHAAIVEQTPKMSLYVSLGHQLVLTSVVLLVLAAPKCEFGAGAGARGTASGQCKESFASFISLITFSWVGSLVWKAYRSPLEVEDSGSLSADQKASHLGLAFGASTSPSHSMMRRLLRFYQKELLLQGIWAACMSITIYMPTLLMKTILTYLEDPKSTESSTAWLCVFLLFVSGVVTSAAECQCEWIGRKISGKSRSILIGEIYRKVLRRQAGAGQSSQTESANPEPSAGSPTEGAIFNLMAVDSELISEVSAHIHLLWVTTPLQLLIGTIMLYQILGPSGLAGLALMILMLPLNTFLANKQGDVQGQLLTATDSRTELTNEALKNIRLIKLNAWTEFFCDRIRQARRNELVKLRLKFIWWSFGMTVWYSTPLLIAFTSLLFFTVVANNQLVISVAFPALTVFGILRLPIDRAAEMISYVLQARVSLSRVEAFLREEGIRERTVGLSPVERGTFLDATLTWPHSSAKVAPDTSNPGGIRLTDFSAAGAFRLSGINLSARHGRLTIVYGSSGSGKSALLLGMLGEMKLLNGTAFSPCSIDSDERSDPWHNEAIAYCAQEPWLMNRSLRDNITFGSPFNGYRYATVLAACSLLHDFKSLDHGDHTLAGDRGSRLSGGQKQRIALARAIYSSAKLVVLDDCLSALDPTTARHVFFEAIKGELMQGRTCVLATHNVQLTIRHCDHAIRLEQGSIVDQGTGEYLLNAGLTTTEDVNDSHSEGGNAAHESLQIPNIISFHDATYSTDQIDQGPELETEPLMTNGPPERSPNGNETELEESKFTGSISWRVSESYLKSMGSGGFWVFALSTFAIQELANLGTNVWIKQWAQQYGSSKDDTASNVQQAVDPKFYLTIYAVLCAAFIVVSLLRDLVAFWGALRSSSHIHEKLLKSVLGARLGFFDRASQGQVLNRFSKDVQAVDQSIATNAMSTLHLLAGIVTTLILISVVVPTFILGAILICCLYYILLNIYINSSRDLKRIESIQRSPLYQHFGETNTGYLTIRAFRRCAASTAQLHDLVDRFTCPHIMLWASKEWLTFRVGLASSSISCITGALSLWFLGSTRAGAAGLIMSYAATFAESIFFFVQLYAIVQQDLSSVQRIDEYTSLEQEPSKTGMSYAVPPPQWPSQGSVQFTDYTTRYTTALEPVLRQLNIKARSGLRTAIVGRTGAGKSTLTMALVRALEATEGRITIDGVDIATIDLQRLRQAITVVPQDPTLFSGTLRDNLDPTDNHSDQEILCALGHVQVFPTASQTTAQGDTESESPVPEGETDLSQAVSTLSLGQRQLVCMARALLRGARILVLDEATASMDHDADSRIQAGLRASAVAGKTTVITIAHRLRTIADYDYVYVLDAGRIVEHGTLQSLLQHKGKGAVFRGMCIETGELDLIKRIVSGL